uniref:tRNA (guanine-N(7)-)-methyltransferase n=1 Tax=Coturnix japonica TaxID=93934 RepID=A0A8C2SW67_COTJA
MDWAALYPDFFPVRDNGTQQPGTNPRVEIADVGCGYGGLLVALSPLFPHTLSLGLELRLKVWDFTRERIRALRAANPGRYQNVACVRANAMKHLPHLFRKGQLSKMFFLFPDPHFKRTKHRWRIVSTALLADYGYVLRPGGLVYTITDVPEVHDWMLQHFRAHPLFQDGGATRRVGRRPGGCPCWPRARRGSQGAAQWGAAFPGRVPPVADSGAEGRMDEGGGQRGTLLDRGNFSPLGQCGTVGPWGPSWHPPAPPVTTRSHIGPPPQFPINLLLADPGSAPILHLPPPQTHLWSPSGVGLMPTPPPPSRPSVPQFPLCFPTPQAQKCH